MGEHTEIGWTDATFNPWWGCARVSDGCRNCYAETFAKRTGHDIWGTGGERRFFGDKHWNEPLRWDAAATKAGRPTKVFCASMADVFEDREDLVEPRARLFELIVSTPHLRWQLLTKRPENVLRLVPSQWKEVGCWPTNCGIGATVEHQRAADERVPTLLSIPAAFLFLSAEPLLGDVVLRHHWMVPTATVCWRSMGKSGGLAVQARSAEVATSLRAMGEALGWRGIDWIIVGGESGPKHRPLDLDHARLLRDQARFNGIPFFFKQGSGLYPGRNDELDGERFKEFPPEVLA